MKDKAESTPLGTDSEGQLQEPEPTHPTRYRQSRIERGIEWYTVDAGPLEQDLVDDCQCARCGSSAEFRDCWNCGGEGETEEEDNEDFGAPTVYYRFCEYCQGRGGSWHCISTPEHCEAHPSPGRENIVSTALKSEAWND